MPLALVKPNHENLIVTIDLMPNALTLVKPPTRTYYLN